MCCVSTVGWCVCVCVCVCVCMYSCAVCMCIHCMCAYSWMVYGQLCSVYVSIFVWCVCVSVYVSPIGWYVCGVCVYLQLSDVLVCMLCVPLGSVSM